MSRFRDLNALSTEPYAKPPVPGLIRSLDDAAANTHPYPILVHPLWFRTLCVACNAHPVGPQRSTVALALVDRDVHHRTTHQESHP